MNYHSLFIFWRTVSLHSDLPTFKRAYLLFFHSFSVFFFFFNFTSCQLFLRALLHELGSVGRPLRISRSAREKPQSNGLVSGLPSQKTLQEMARVLAFLPRAKQPPPVLAVSKNEAAGAALASLGWGVCRIWKKDAYGRGDRGDAILG